MFKIHTGAEVTAVSEQVYQEIRARKLQLPSKSLHGPAEHSLEVLGEVKGHHKHKHKVVVARTIKRSCSTSEEL